MTPPVIEVIGLSKKFAIGREFGDIRQSIKNIFSIKNKNKSEIWALDDVNFKIQEGEVFGIIGPNGSGKSTLLKILSKITYPTRGKAILRGRVASLLEVGTGFHPELTGRENIYLNGSILGMKRQEIKKKFNEIVDFSGIETFIDTPVKHYSSGMYVRLAFSVAAHLEPEILLVDEVLSVGDLEFREKSMGKMKDVANNGRTVLFVSHNLGFVKNICKKGMLLSEGKVKYQGDILKVVNKYQENAMKTSNDSALNISNNFFKIKNIKIVNKSNYKSDIISAGDDIEIKIRYEKKEELKNLLVKIIIKDNQQVVLFSCDNNLVNTTFNNIPKHGEFVCQIPKIPLNIGVYLIDLYIESNKNIVFAKTNISNFEVFAGNFFKSSLMPLSNRIFLVEHSWSIKKQI